MNGNKKITIMALAAVSAVVCVFCVQMHFRSGIPSWVTWENSVFSDQTGMYEIELSHKKVKIKYSTNTIDDQNAKYDIDLIWTSPKEIEVQKALSCDIDNDNMDELVLLCWKKGRYGEHRPFWVEKDEETWSQHLFVYEYSADKISPKWMSSYIGQDIEDITSNGKDAPDTRLWFQSPDDEMSSWVWDSWGFTKEDAEITFTVFGDILAHEPIYRYGLQKDVSFGFLFENVRDMISACDVAIINQETPLTDNPLMFSDYPRFGTPVNVGQAIVDAGFDVVTCATNHALDRGVDGVDFTKSFFEANHITCLGIQTTDEQERIPYELIRRNGVRFALFNYTYGTNGIRLPDENPNRVHLFSDERQIQEDIAKAKAEVDFVIVFAHWGTEYATEPDEFQQKWTQLFLDSKVDIVVGTHPHTLQSYELLTGEDGHQMLVYYSIGNYISAQSEKSCVKGGMAEFTISLKQTGYQITTYNLEPLTIVWSQGGKYSVKFP